MGSPNPEHHLANLVGHTVTDGSGTRWKVEKLYVTETESEGWFLIRRFGRVIRRADPAVIERWVRARGICTKKLPAHCLTCLGLETKDEVLPPAG